MPCPVTDEMNTTGRSVGRVSFSHLDELLVQQVTLGDGEHAMLVEHLWVEVLQLAQQHLVFLLDVVGIAWNHEEEQRVALDVSQESRSQALSFARSLDDTGISAITKL